MTRHHSPLLALLLIAALAAACGGEDGGAPPGGGASNNDAATNNDAASNNDAVSNNGGTSNNGASNNDAPDAGEDSGAEDVGGEDTGAEDVGEDDVAMDVGEDTGPDVPPDVVEDAPPDVDCTSFRLAAPTYPALPLRNVFIEAFGGSGEYRFTFPDGGNVSGGDLDTFNGNYLTGPTPGVTDTVEVKDVACPQVLTAFVDVVTPATLRPSQPELPPGSQLCFEVEGGFGPFTWDISLAASGEDAAIDQEGCYTAGAEPGVDFILVTDEGTGQVMQAAADVRTEGIRITFSADALMLPPGESFPITAEGASGAYTFTLTDGSPEGAALAAYPDAPDSGVTFEAGETPGTATLVATDAFFPDISATIDVTVMSRAHHEPGLYSTHTDEHDLQGVGDVNGDGYEDVVLSVRHWGGNGFSSGAAFLYLGGQEQEGGGLGLSAEPAQVITGDRRNHYLGRSIASGDFDGDGCSDVAVGVWGENLTGSQVGEVKIYRGCNTEPLDASPRQDWNGRLADNLPGYNDTPPLALWRRVPGISNFDRFGWTVLAGDFNGDGKDDLASAAYLAEASSRINLADGEPWSNIGRVYLFYQGDDGVSVLPDVVLDGVFVDDSGQITSADNFNLGSAMAAGDLNGDSCEDLLVGSYSADGSQGAASLYLSVPADGGCELPPEPALTIHPDPTEDLGRASRLGWRVAMEDMDGDCRLDLVLTQPYAPTHGGANSNNGALLIFKGDDAWSHDAPTRLLSTDADLIVNADTNDHFGFGMDTGDVDGDGITDVITGSRYAEHEGTINNVGEVRVYPGLIDPDGCQGAAPEASLLGEPTVIPNRANGEIDFFGQQVSLVGDVDGDDQPDLAVFAERGPSSSPDDHLDHQGRLYWHPGGPVSWSFDTMVPVDTPFIAYDDRLGWATENVGDVNDDGFTDFVLTAPWWDLDIPRAEYTTVAGNAGGAFLHLGGPDGVRATPDAVFGGHSGHSGSDIFGYSASPAGDVDGDGVDDLAVGVPFEDANGICQRCRNNNAYRNDIGAVYVYRGRAGLATRLAEGAPLPRLSAPDFVYCGPQRNNIRVSREVSGGFDVNGDGRDDLVMSNWNWSGQRGEVHVALGQPAGDAPVVTCMSDADRLGRGDNRGDYVGYGLGGADLDGDGCAEMFASGYNDDSPDLNNTGALHVWTGFGGLGCPAQRRHVTFYGAVANDNVGYRMTVPGDMNGDGVDDVVLGSAGYGVTNTGAALIYDGAAIGAQLGGAADGAELTLTPSLLVAQIITPQNINSTNFAYGLRGAGDVNGDGRADLVIGERFSSLSGVLRRGAAYVYYGSPSSTELERPDIVVGGLATFQDSQFGGSVAAGRVGDRAVVLVGAPMAEWIGPEFGEMGEVFIGTVDTD